MGICIGIANGGNGFGCQSSFSDSGSLVCIFFIHKKYINKATPEGDVIPKPYITVNTHLSQRGIKVSFILLIRTIHFTKGFLYTVPYSQ